MTKFLILVEDSDWVSREIDDVSVQTQLVGSDHQYMEIITCHHENFNDNCIEIEGYELVRDVDGRLFYFTDHMTKGELIKRFERNKEDV